MSSKSLSDVAFDKLKRKKKEVLFARLWKEVSDEVSLTEEMAKRRVASFYNALMMDSRFISLEGNKWDLRERHSLESLKIDPDLLEGADDSDDDYEDYGDLLISDDE